MAFLNGIGLNSVVGQFSTSHELSQLREIQKNGTANNYANGAYGLTTSGKGGLVLTEMQNEENTTFLFEYRAYLNSQLTTIVTKLTNALASDLDSVMMLQNQNFQGAYSPRSNMQGATTNKQMDPGAGRTTLMYLGSWRTIPSVADAVSISGTNYGSYVAGEGGFANTAPWIMSTAGPASWSVSIKDGTFTQNGTASAASGTLAVMTYGNNPIGMAGPNDTLFVDYENLGVNDFQFSGSRSTQFNVTDPSAKAGNLAGNKFQEVLYRESKTAVFRNVLKADLLRDLVISASTSLSTGSQLQASISLNSRRAGSQPNTNYSARNPTATGFDTAVDIFLNRFTAFYHT
jgi:hypothetical protein